MKTLHLLRKMLQNLVHDLIDTCQILLFEVQETAHRLHYAVSVMLAIN